MSSLNTDMDITTLTMTASLLLLITICAYLFYWKYKDFPPGPYGLPLLGYTLFLGKEPHVTFRNLGKKYGNILSVNLGGRQTVILNDWQSIREVLIKQGDSFSNRPAMFMFQVMFHDNDIASASGPVHKELKRITTQILKNFGMGRSSLESTVVEEVERLVTHLKTQDGQLVKIDSLIYIPALNVIWGIMSETTFDINDAEMRYFADTVHRVVRQNSVNIVNMFPALRFVAPALTGYTTFANGAEIIHAYIEQVVDKHYEDDKDGQQTDFIHAFIAEIKKRRKDNKEQPPYCKEKLIGIVLDMFYAGVETTNTTMHWALLLMAVHPEIQKKVQQELDERIAADSHLPYSAKSTIPYTQATLCEIQRFASMVPLSIPHCATKEATLCGYKIPKGTSVMVNLWALHHNEEYWGDPEEFRPGRFLDEEGQLKDHDPFLPFGAGPRKCLGEPMGKLELTLFFASLMRRFTFKMDPNCPTPTSSSKLETVEGIVLRPLWSSLILKCR